MRIVLEGIWGSPLNYLVEQLAERGEVPFDRIKICIPPPPFNGLKGWTYALTENMRIWKEQDDQEDKVYFYEHSVWSSYAFARALTDDSQMSKDELALFEDMTTSLSELHKLPDCIIYCHCFPQEAHKRLVDKEEVCAYIEEDGLRDTSKSMIAWLDEMKAKGVKVFELPPPLNEDSMDNWYRYAIKTLSKVFNN